MVSWLKRHMSSMVGTRSCFHLLSWKAAGVLCNHSTLAPCSIMPHDASATLSHMESHTVQAASCCVMLIP